MPTHFLPATYWSYRDPLVIALVGAPMSGKTMLLAAMIREAFRDGLTAYGVQTAALDLRRHDAYQRRFVAPFEGGELLPGTHEGITEPADILLMRSPTGSRPVVFYDVAGEDLLRTDAFGPSTRHLLAADAVLFVHPLDDPADANTAWCFELTSERLLSRPGGAQHIPAAIAVTKSDRLRYVPPVDRWLRSSETSPLDAARIRAQSRDVYAYLHSRDALGSLRPYEFLDRCTLHFVSATGGDPIPIGPVTDPARLRFPRGVRPAQVLAPLVAILAMTGVISDPEAHKVGVA
jgi:hypothetical protein